MIAVTFIIRAGSSLDEIQRRGVCFRASPSRRPSFLAAAKLVSGIAVGALPRQVIGRSPVNEPDLAFRIPPIVITTEIIRHHFHTVAGSFD